MILSHDDIVRDIKPGALIFNPPLEAEQIRESSIDLPLGNEFFRWMRLEEIERDPDPAISSPERRIRLKLPPRELAGHLEEVQRLFTKRTSISNDGIFALNPGDFVLVQVSQYMQLPDYLAGRVEGRTRFARTGLEVHSTAPTIRAGWSGHLTLELKNVGPLVFLLTPGDRICQVILERVLTPPSVRVESQY